MRPLCIGTTQEQVHSGLLVLEIGGQILNIVHRRGHGAVKKGFDEVYEKFSKFDERFEKLELKIDRMDSRFTNQLDYFHLYYPTKLEFTNLDTRVKKIEKRMKVRA